jgi:hypothetical protein
MTDLLIPLSPESPRLPAYCMKEGYHAIQSGGSMISKLNNRKLNHEDRKMKLVEVFGVFAIRITLRPYPVSRD